MLRDDADFFSTRYDDMVREPDKTWRDWVGEAAVGDQKTLFVADEDDRWLGVVGAFVRVEPARGAADLDVGRSAGSRPRASRRPSSAPLRNGRRSEARRRSSSSSRRRTSRPSSSTSGPASGATGDRTPASAGRSAFKLVLAAPVDDLLRLT